VKLPLADQRAEQSPAQDEGTASAELWERVWERQNLFAALERVERNGGAPGIDGMQVEELRPYLKEGWMEIREALNQQTYQPSPVRRVEIPKPDGGMRLLGIPTVLDRFLQQAIAQALTGLFEPLFSNHSYGFRPGRSAQQAIEQAQAYVQVGYEWVVDIDLEKFFDRVNHDMLMARVARVVKDKRVLKLIRAYLNSGVMVNGVVLDTEEGTPQGGPLSPLLSNIMLDDLDKELEKRGHKFVRYADDCNIYVQTRRAGERVMESVKTFLEKKLKLKVNPKKSKVDRATRVKFLGFSFYKRKGEVLIRVAARSLERFREKLRRLTKRTRSGKLENIIQEINQYTMGWMGYYRQANTPSVFEGLDSWIRRRLRQMVWKRWKRGTTCYRELVKLGVPRYRAGLGAVGKSPWHMSKSPVINEALSNSYFRNLGLKSLKVRYQELRIS
jgi:group II intron reverse transcriptase/maturase